MYAFIVNPNARTGLGLKTWNHLESLLKAWKVEYQACLTRYPGHATEFARDLTDKNPDLILIVLGGDGTINEVINGIRNLSKTTLGYIPIGSSNDFARSMKICTDSEQMLKQILSPSEYTYINIGQLTLKNSVRRFAVSSGIGFDADVCFHNTSSKFKRWLNRLHLGRLSYTGVALFLLLTLAPRSMTLTIDGRKKHFEKVFFVTAMNQRYEGGGFKFCPEADPCDDLLDILVVADISKLKALFLLPTAYKGWHTHFKGVHTYTCHRTDVISRKTLPVHTDGEASMTASGLSFSLETDKLRFIRA